MKDESPHAATLPVDRHGELAVLTPSPAVVTAPEDVLERAGKDALEQLRALPPRGVVVDLSQVDYFGSLFISMLVRCHTLLRKQGSKLVIAGASARARELLRLTALDELWAQYPTRMDAVQAFSKPA